MRWPVSRPGAVLTLREGTAASVRSSREGRNRALRHHHWATWTLPFLFPRGSTAVPEETTMNSSCLGLLGPETERSRNPGQEPGHSVGEPSASQEQRPRARARQQSSGGHPHRKPVMGTRPRVEGRQVTQVGRKLQKQGARAKRGKNQVSLCFSQ